jgi:hypothetical protein
VAGWGWVSGWGEGMNGWMRVWIGKGVSKGERTSFPSPSLPHPHTHTLKIVISIWLLSHSTSSHLERYKTEYEVILKDLLSYNRKKVLSFRTQKYKKILNYIIVGPLCKNNMRSMTRMHDPSR